MGRTASPIALLLAGSLALLPVSGPLAQSGEGQPPRSEAAPAPAPTAVPVTPPNGTGSGAATAAPPTPASPGAPPSARPAPLPAFASDEGRRSLVPLAEPLWNDLTAAQRAALAPFAAEWNSWPIAEKKSWVALANRIPRMDPEKRAVAARRIDEWAGLNPEERRLARANYRLAKDRPAEARVSEWEQYRSMTSDQRSVLRQAGSTSNTAAGHAGAATGLAKEASQPLPRRQPAPGTFSLVPASGTPR